MNLTQIQRRAAFIIIKYTTETALDNMRRITNEYLLKDYIERQRRAEEIGGLYDRRN